MWRRLFQGAEGQLLAIEAALARARRDGVTRLEIGENIWEEFLALCGAGLFSAAELDEIRLNGLSDE